MIDLDCEQSISFTSVFLAFLRVSVELSSSEMRTKKKKKGWLGINGVRSVHHISFASVMTYSFHCFIRSSTW